MTKSHKIIAGLVTAAVLTAGGLSLNGEDVEVKEATETPAPVGLVQRVSIEKSYDQELSLRSFSPGEVKDYDFNGKMIYASFFGQEVPDTHIFPDDLTGATFLNCNLDNVFIPDGNVVINDGGGSRKKFTVQNDLEDWIVDDHLKPVEPLDKKRFLDRQLSIDPKDIPSTKLNEAITSQLTP